MGDCLVTKLKSLVADDSLFKVNDFVLHVSAADQNQLRINISGLVTVRTTGSGSFTVGDSVESYTTYTIADDEAYTMKFLTGQDYKVFIENADHLIGFYCVSVVSNSEDLISIAYPSLSSLTTRRVLTGNIKDLGTSRLGIVDLEYDTKISGDLVDFCTAEVANGRSSGGTTIKLNGIITVNNSAVSNGVTKYIRYGTSLPAGAEYSGTGFSIYANAPD